MNSSLRIRPISIKWQEWQIMYPHYFSLRYYCCRPLFKSSVSNKTA